ncbi:unnamed protein product [Sympodiomycopsis kandeliae]
MLVPPLRIHTNDNQQYEHQTSTRAHNDTKAKAGMQARNRAARQGRETQQPAAKKRKAANPWSAEEILALERAKTKATLLNMAIVQEEPETSNRTRGQINTKLRNDMKAAEKAAGNNAK